MKSIELRHADDTLKAYATSLGKEPIVLTRHGRAFAALIRIGDADLESLRVGSSPVFQAIVKKSEAEYRRTGGLTEEQLLTRIKSGQATSTRRSSSVRSSTARKPHRGKLGARGA